LGGGVGGGNQCGDGMGYQVCRGPNHCPTATNGCNGCDLGSDQRVGMCETPAFKLTDHFGSWECQDGSIYAGDGIQDQEYFCVPFAFASLYCRNDSVTELRYADYSTVTCPALLPSPMTCPAVSGFQLCGPACGPCPPNQACTGRSPLHPYSVCVPSTYNNCSPASTAFCAATESCFIFVVDSAAQPTADKHGLCIDTTQCQAIAAGYPGGAKCVPKM